MRPLKPNEILWHQAIKRIPHLALKKWILHCLGKKRHAAYLVYGHSKAPV
jgi:hypothetical protein